MPVRSIVAECNAASISSEITVHLVGRRVVSPAADVGSRARLIAALRTAGQQRFGIFTPRSDMGGGYAGSTRERSAGPNHVEAEVRCAVPVGSGNRPDPDYTQTSGRSDFRAWRRKGIAMCSRSAGGSARTSPGRVACGSGYAAEHPLSSRGAFRLHGDRFPLRARLRHHHLIHLALVAPRVSPSSRSADAFVSSRRMDDGFTLPTAQRFPLSGLSTPDRNLSGDRERGICRSVSRSPRRI